MHKTPQITHFRSSLVIKSNSPAGPKCPDSELGETHLTTSSWN